MTLATSWHLICHFNTYLCIIVALRYVILHLSSLLRNRAQDSPSLTGMRCYQDQDHGLRKRNLQQVQGLLTFIQQLHWIHDNDAMATRSTRSFQPLDSTRRHLWRLSKTHFYGLAPSRPPRAGKNNVEAFKSIAGLSILYSPNPHLLQHRSNVV